MFLASMEEQHRKLQARFAEIRAVVRDYRMPPAAQYAVNCAIRLPMDVRGRLEEVRSRHGFRTIKDAVYTSMALGLHTLERLEPESKGRPTKVVNGNGIPGMPGARVLSEDEVVRIKDHGFGCDRHDREPAVALEG